MKYEILQVVNTRDHGFMGLEERKDVLKTGAIDLALYKSVYAGEIEGSETTEVLEKIFYRFNITRPADFRGHSLSVSDIVKLGDAHFYCDIVGWKPIDRFIVDSRVTAAGTFGYGEREFIRFLTNAGHSGFVAKESPVGEYAVKFADGRRQIYWYNGADRIFLQRDNDRACGPTLDILRSL